VENESWAETGNAGVWTQITVDEEAGLVYLPVETPTSDYYGGHRPGNNLFAESIVCVDLKTGQRKWHFQLVHHPLWNYDMSSAAIVADIVVDGKPIKALAVAGKQGFVYVFDRITGKPVWPIEERPVPPSDVPGEKASPTQPFPTKPPAYARPILKLPDDLIDFTPDMRARAIEQLKRYKMTSTWMYNPPVLGNVNGLLGSITWETRSAAPTGRASPTIPSCIPCSRRRTTPTSPQRRWSRREGIRHRHSLCLGHGGPRIPRSAWPRRLLRGRFTASGGTN
jgi:quinoprotein glucose dehydrogenase